MAHALEDAHLVVQLMVAHVTVKVSSSRPLFTLPLVLLVTCQHKVTAHTCSPGLFNRPIAAGELAS